MTNTPNQRTTRSNSLRSTATVSRQLSLGKRDVTDINVSQAILSEVKQMLDNMKDELIQTLKGEILSLRDSLQSLSARVCDIESKNKALSEELARVKETNFERVTEEIEERKKREANIVIFGFSERVNGTVEQRKSHDLGSTKSLINALGITNFEVNSIRRLGASSGNGKRPLLVTLGSFQQKFQVVKASPGLRKLGEYKGIFVKCDLTQMQQSQQRRLITELKERRQRGENVVIRRNEVVIRRSEQDFH